MKNFSKKVCFFSRPPQKTAQNPRNVRQETSYNRRGVWGWAACFVVPYSNYLRTRRKNTNISDWLAFPFFRARPLKRRFFGRVFLVKILYINILSFSNFVIYI